MSDCDKARKELKLTSNCCCSCHEELEMSGLCTIEANGKSYEVCCDLWSEYHTRERFLAQVNCSPVDKPKQLLEKAYLAGFNASSESYSAEYPFGQENQQPEDDAEWCRKRDQKLKELMEETNG